MTGSDGIEIGTASEHDLEGILTLQEANQPERGGTLSARLSRAQLQAMLADLPTTLFWVIDRMLPQEAAAVDGVKSTLSPQASAQAMTVDG